MAQERKLIFGALIETEDLPVAISNIMSPGRLIGMVFEVSASDLLRITPGSCLLPDGVIILENASKQLLISNSSFAADYTVVYQLEDTRVLGGSPATLRLLPGILRQDVFTDSVVLGWVKYPGGSVPLSDSHFVQPNSVRVKASTGALLNTFLPPFAAAIRPVEELRGAPTIKTVRQTNLSTAFSTIQSYAGQTARVTGASITTDSTSIVGHNTNFDTFAIKRSIPITASTTSASTTLTNVNPVSRVALNQSISGPGIPAGATVVSIVGTSVTMSALASLTATGSTLAFLDTLYTYDTRLTQQGGITFAQPTPMIKASLPPDRFFLQPTDVVVTQNTVSNSPTAASGEINVVAEVPGSSGNWQESFFPLSGEHTYKFLNIGALTSTYNLLLPFVITGEGQPRKLLSRLNVDFNVIVTFSLVVGGTTVTLEPVSGTVANTGGLITREFTIPFVSGVTWTPGKTAQIKVSINAQPGGSAAFAHVALSLENTPYLIFI